MKLTKHQTNLVLYAARQAKISPPGWINSAKASAACGGNWSQRHHGTWALPKLRTLEEKGLLVSYQYQHGAGTASKFRLNDKNPEAFKFLLKV